MRIISNIYHYPVINYMHRKFVTPAKRFAQNRMRVSLGSDMKCAKLYKTAIDLLRNNY